MSNETKTVRVKQLPTGEYAVLTRIFWDRIEWVALDSGDFTEATRAEWDELPDVTLAPVPEPTHARDLRADGQLMRERDALRTTLAASQADVAAARALVRRTLKMDPRTNPNFETEGRQLTRDMVEAVAAWDKEGE